MGGVSLIFLVVSLPSEFPTQLLAANLTEPLCWSDPMNSHILEIISEILSLTHKAHAGIFPASNSPFPFWLRAFTHALPTSDARTFFPTSLPTILLNFYSPFWSQSITSSEPPSMSSGSGSEPLGIVFTAPCKSWLRTKNVLQLSLSNQRYNWGGDESVIGTPPSTLLPKGTTSALLAAIFCCVCLH